MKTFILCLLVVLPAMSSATCRRLHRSSLPEEYYDDFADEASYAIERIPKRLPCYTRRTTTPLTRSYYDTPYPLGLEAPSYSYPLGSYPLTGSLNYPAPVVSKGIGGSICSPLGSVRGHIGCGGLSGSVVTPLGTSVSGSIGTTIHQDPCRPCAHHGLSSVHYL